MLDFTSALYLGFGHPSTALRPWARLTTGAPAALAQPDGSAGVQRALAALLGLERATLAPSTLHAFWDLFGILARPADVIYLARDAYPIARWGVERVAARGIRTRGLGDPAALRRLVRRDPGRPLVVLDGLDLDGGRPAPIGAYLDAVRERAGRIVIDDTQALGILGSAPGPNVPYGTGGGGSARLHSLAGRDVVVVASFAKAFGVPLAVVAGADAVVERYESEGETRLHCSAPSTAVLRAAERALVLNERHGDSLRLRLAALVRRFRRGLGRLGLAAAGGTFPFQTVAVDVHAQLLARGVRAIPRENGVTFLFTALHRPADVDRAVEALGEAMRDRARRHERRVS